jgi:Tfp pilus assembly protein PilZ
MQKFAAPALLKLQFRDLATLRDCYMPYLSTRGLFLPGITGYRLGDSLALLFTFPGTMEQHMTVTKVVWINPELISEYKPAGIGVQFKSSEKALSAKIEALLASETEDYNKVPEDDAGSCENFARTQNWPQNAISATLQSATGLIWEIGEHQ